ncbi:ATP-dependent helicase [Marinomonas sp. TI.3.20]|uniref:ATP-dependent helicase n=1 Tax=Marinomonas sp. TI.3.20 TaxID=3121296 RepID=UPI00311D3ACA
MKYVEEQIKAIEAPFTNHVRIIANAGSGKTEVLAERIARATSTVSDPSKIWVSSFTNESASELADRIASKLPASVAERIYITNIHKMCTRILRESFEMFPDGAYVPKNKPRIVTKKVQRKMLLSVVKQLVEAGKLEEDLICLEEISNHVFEWKSAGQDVSSAISFANDIGIVYESMLAEIVNSGCYDFDDIIAQCNLILDNNEDILTYFKSKIEHFYVDEFQDINAVQEQFIRLLAAEKHISIVGDDSQSIFRFRGATSEYFIRFNERFDNVDTYFLSTNFRSVSTIVEASSYIVKESAKIQKEYKSQACGIDDTNALRYIEAENDDEESQRIAAEILALKSLGVELSKMAILCRTNNQIESIQTHLEPRGIPVHAVNNKSFFQRHEVMMALGLIEAANTKSKPAFTSGLQYVFEAFGVNVAEISNETLLSDVLESIKDISRRIEIESVIDKLGSAKNKEEVVKIITTPSIYGNYFAIEGKDPVIYTDAKSDSRLHNLELLGKGIMACTGSTTEDILNEVMLNGLNAQSANVDRLTIMTIHASKGKQFDVVFVPGMYNGSFPINSHNSNDIEEANLAFVAITRARHLSYMIGRTGKKSTFVEAIPNYLVYDAKVAPSLEISELGDKVVKGTALAHKMAMQELSKTVANCCAFTQFSKIKTGLNSLRNTILAKGKLDAEFINSASDDSKSLMRILFTNTKLLDLSRIELDFALIGKFLRSTPPRLTF